MIRNVSSLYMELSSRIFQFTLTLNTMIRSLSSLLADLSKSHLYTSPIHFPLMQWLLNLLTTG